MSPAGQKRKKKQRKRLAWEANPPPPSTTNPLNHPQAQRASAAVSPRNPRRRDKTRPGQGRGGEKKCSSQYFVDTRATRTHACIVCWIAKRVLKKPPSPNSTLPFRLFSSPVCVLCCVWIFHIQQRTLLRPQWYSQSTQSVNRHHPQPDDLVPGSSHLPVPPLSSDGRIYIYIHSGPLGPLLDFLFESSTGTS